MSESIAMNNKRVEDEIKRLRAGRDSYTKETQQLANRRAMENACIKRLMENKTPVSQLDIVNAVLLRKERITDFQDRYTYKHISACSWVRTKFNVSTGVLGCFEGDSSRYYKLYSKDERGKSEKSAYVCQVVMVMKRYSAKALLIDGAWCDTEYIKREIPGVRIYRKDTKTGLWKAVNK